MNTYCSNCGFKLREQSKFCANCGLSMVQEQQDVPRQSPVPVVPVQQQNTYNQEYNGVCQKSKDSPKFNYILFIFITSLIILLHFISRTLDMLTSSITWVFVDYGFKFMITLGVFVIAIVHFVAATNSFYKQNPIKKRANSANKLSALSLTIAILSTVLLFIDNIVLFSAYKINFAAPHLFESLFMKKAVSELIFDVFFIIFAFINMVKARKFKAEINNKLFEQD